MYQSYTPLLEQYSDEIVQALKPPLSKDKPYNFVALTPKKLLARPLNPKQCQRILKRRMARSKQHTFKRRGSFTYANKHKKAILRRRASNGRFLGGHVNISLQNPKVVIEKIGTLSDSDLSHVKQEEPAKQAVTGEQSDLQAVKEEPVEQVQCINEIVSGLKVQQESGVIKQESK